jgi:ribosome maturation factor RimP
MNNLNSQSESIRHSHDQLIQLITPWITPIGYQIIHLEVQSHRQKVLRIFIDHTAESLLAGATIGIEDCVKVSRAIDEQLDQSSEVQALLPGAYELEVSSPGVDRPLRTAQDFVRFSGKEARIHIYRPLTEEEIQNSTYQQKNPKQKNFLGMLRGLENSKIVLLVSTHDQSSNQPRKKSKAKNNASLETNSVEGNRITIPLPLISKANLEPQFDFDFEGSNERES